MKKYVFVKQDDLKDCGASCLLMIIKTYKGGCSKEFLRELTKTTKDGTNFYNISKAAEYFNFESYGTNCNIFDIADSKLPVIAQVLMNNSFKHFIVIYEINRDKNYAIVGDPGKSKIEKIKISELNKISSNNFLLFFPRGKILKIKSNPV